MRYVHVSTSDLSTLLEGEASAGLAEHLFACGLCWRHACKFLSQIQGRRDSLPSKEPRRWALVERYRLEQSRLEEDLGAVALVASIRGLEQKQRKDAVSREKRFHTYAAVHVLLAEARAAGAAFEGEEWAGLAIVATHQIQGPPGDPARADLLAHCYADLARARRRSARWPVAREAIRQGHDHLKNGSGSDVSMGRLLFVEGCIEGDLGNLDLASDLLARAADKFMAAGELGLAAKSMVQNGYVWLDAEAAKTLSFLACAESLIPMEDKRLHMFAESIRVDALITLGETHEAMRRFDDLGATLDQFTDPFVQLRRQFTIGRLLEALGRFEEAEAIFRDAIAVDLDRRSSRAFFLDLVYLVGFKSRLGDLEGALEVCEMALSAIDSLVLDYKSQEQIKRIWEGLDKMIRAGALETRLLVKVKLYIKTQWRILGGDALLVKESA